MKNDILYEKRQRCVFWTQPTRNQCDSSRREADRTTTGLSVSSLPQVWPHLVASELCSRFLQVVYGKKELVGNSSKSNNRTKLTPLVLALLVSSFHDRFYKKKQMEKASILWLRTSWNRVRKGEVINSTHTQRKTADTMPTATPPHADWRAPKVTSIIAQRGQPRLCSW